MEFWGIEVKPGETVKCDPGFDTYIHLSQAALGEVKKGKSTELVMSVKVDGPKMVIGTLAPEKFPQVSFDLVFEKEFELSHNGKSSVHFSGYKSFHDDNAEDFSGMSDAKLVSSKPAVGKANAVKSDSKSKAKAEPVKAEKSKEDKDEDNDDDDDDDDDEFEEDESGSDEDMTEDSDESDEDEEDEDSSEDEKEATPKKVETGKKRTNDSTAKTPVPDKKAKLAIPSGGDGKKGGHTATPHPIKPSAKTLANGEKSKQPQTPKSGGQVSCKSCSKTFNSEGALLSHTKAKHSADK
ncbi:histone deacetylase HDT2-like isoform X2 [Aristolochia californica]|uniref:histone deacetylase HDT2-like isoform X2 n=1 Tax=Aristolochia californica TaxID=171875 RepID=UPI0035E2D0D9